MEVECYRVRVPEHVRLTGFTASGRWVRVLPGEHVVHRVKPKVPLKGFAQALRFLAADGEHDIHIPLPDDEAVEAALGSLTPVLPHALALEHRVAADPDAAEHAVRQDGLNSSRGQPAMRFSTPSMRSKVAP